jgi:hypothetical protein
MTSECTDILLNGTRICLFHDVSVASVLHIVSAATCFTQHRGKLFPTLLRVESVYAYKYCDVFDRRPPLLGNHS